MKIMKRLEARAQAVHAAWSSFARSEGCHPPEFHSPRIEVCAYCRSSLRAWDNLDEEAREAFRVITRAAIGTRPVE